MKTLRDILHEMAYDITHDPLTGNIEEMRKTWRRTTWHDKHPTNKQRAVLVDNGYAVPPTRGEAASLISSFLGGPNTVPFVHRNDGRKAS